MLQPSRREYYFSGNWAIIAGGGDEEHRQKLFVN
jgi:hypothetical protein